MGPRGADELDGAMQVGRGFEVHADLVGAGLRHRLHIAFGLDNHQVAIEVGASPEVGPQGGHHGHPHGNIGHKTSVHHIDMQAVAAPSQGCLGVSPQGGEIGRQQRRTQPNRAVLGMIHKHVMIFLAGRNSASFIT
jgi:hypothetical protein